MVVDPRLTPENVREAHALIEFKIHKTPLLTCATLTGIASREAESEGDKASEPGPKIKLFFKCENFQKTGSFKFRGATHSVARLSDEQLKKGVLTHSSG